MAEAKAHPQADALLQEIDGAGITTKKVKIALEMQRGGFDVVKKVTKVGLRSYFGEYSPPAKHMEVGMNFSMRLLDFY